MQSLIIVVVIIWNDIKRLYYCFSFCCVMLFQILCSHKNLCSLTELFFNWFAKRQRILRILKTQFQTITVTCSQHCSILIAQSLIVLNVIINFLICHCMKIKTNKYLELKEHTVCDRYISYYFLFIIIADLLNCTCWIWNWHIDICSFRKSFFNVFVINTNNST